MEDQGKAPEAPPVNEIDATLCLQDIPQTQVLEVVRDDNKQVIATYLRLVTGDGMQGQFRLYLMTGTGWTLLEEEHVKYVNDLFNIANMARLQPTGMGIMMPESKVRQ